MYKAYVDQHNMVDTPNLDVCFYLKKIFECCLNGGIGDLTSDDLELLLRDDAHSDVMSRDHIHGYPSFPLYREVSARIDQWFNTGYCPFLDLQKYDLLDEKDYHREREEKSVIITPLLSQLKDLLTSLSEDEIRHRLQQLIEALGRRGLLDLLGIRCTVGSVTQWPPARKALLETFNQPHKAGSSLLTVGARAFSKHCHRDTSSSWWGESTGTEAAKNDSAEKVVSNILDDAHWINIHQLPHDVVTLEVRQQQGYGARWTADAKQFRGFLEPQMEDGHNANLGPEIFRRW